MSLAGRVALITGASSGIGLACARVFASEGLRVVLAARRGDRLAHLCAEITAAGGSALPLTIDVTSDADVDRLIAETLRHFGQIDIVLCNAGLGFHGSLEQTPPDAMARLMDLNFMGTFLVARATLPHLKRQPHGHLLLVSSIVGKRGIAFGGAYSATKFAQTGLAEALRAELLDTSVRVSAVYPVSTETEFRDVIAREQGYRVRGHGPRQSAEHVAASMVRCLKHPTPEVYPHWPSRLLVILNALAPGLSDRVIRRFGRRPDSAEPITHPHVQP
jgi:NAD(P)-dependent dehydrogenase (short-subunit alcohol dehydrogenase family)